jgi:anaerobic magnesium-protoporphyrin IX monomethyl ester cyclase
MKPQENATIAPITGPEIRLDKLVECACSLSMDTLMSALYRNEWMRNNPGRMTGQLLSILADPEILRFGRNLAMLFISTYRKSGS